MSFINPDDLISRIGNDENILKEESFIDDLINGVVLNRTERKEGRGRAEGDNNIPPIFQDVIAIQANVSGQTQKDLANAYGISPNRVALYKQGLTTQKGDTAGSERLSKTLEASLGKVRDKALDRIMKSLECIGDDKLEDRTAKELSSIAANLSRVVSAAMPKKDDNPVINNYQTVFYAPEVKTVDSYPVIEA